MMEYDKNIINTSELKRFVCKEAKVSEDYIIMLNEEVEQIILKSLERMKLNKRKVLFVRDL